MPNHPYEREHTMTQEKSTQARANLKALVAEDKDFLREIVREAMQQILSGLLPESRGSSHSPHTTGFLHAFSKSLGVL